MPDNVFQPDVAVANSAVTPSEGVVDRSAVDLFSTVAQVATDATFSYTGQQELSDLNKKFDRIVQARQSGKSSTPLLNKARTALDEARANAPWITAEADKLFKEKFSGGSSTGIFKATPEEKAQDAYRQRVEEVKQSLGLPSSEEAVKYIKLEEHAKLTKIQADAQKEVREYNGDLVFANTQAQLNQRSVALMSKINEISKANAGTLSKEDLRSFNNTVDLQVLKLKEELNSQVRDPKTGHLLTDKGTYEDNLKEIEDWSTDIKAVAKDSDYTKVMTDLNNEQMAEVNLLAVKMFKPIAIANAAGGQAHVKAMLDAAKRPEGAAKQLLIESSPIAKELFKQQGSFMQAGGTGLTKIWTPNPENLLLSESEALATGAILNDPANAKLLTATLDQATTNEEAVQPFESIITKNPESSAMLWSKVFKDWSLTKPEKAKKVLTSGVGALKKSFLSAYVSSTGTLPSDFTFEVGARGRFTLRGEGIDNSTGAMLRNMYNVYKANPIALSEVASQSGVSDITPEDAVRYTILGDKAFPEEEVVEVKKAPGRVGKGGDSGTTEFLNNTLGKFARNLTSQLTSKNTSGKKSRFTKEDMYTEDDLTLMINNGYMTEDDATLFRERGLVIDEAE